MKFFHPQVQLAREFNLDQPPTYYLHIVTFCPGSSFRADGHTTDAGALTDGLYKVSIKLRQDPDLPDLKYITPVVHTLDLGIIDFPGGEGAIEVQVLGAVLETTANGGRSATDPPTTTTKTGGTGTVSTTSAEDISRPIDSDSL